MPPSPLGGWKLQEILVPLDPYSSFPPKNQARHVSSSEASGKMMSRGFTAPCYRYFWFTQQQKSQASKCFSKTIYLAGNSFFPAGFLLGITLLAPKSAPHTQGESLFHRSLGLHCLCHLQPRLSQLVLLPSWSLASAPPGGTTPPDLLIETPTFKVIFMDPHHIPQR